MRLSTLVLCCVMILSCTRLLDGTARRLRIRVGTLAALCPLLAAASAFSFDVLTVLRMNLAVAMLLIFCALLCKDAMAFALSQLLAACMGACGFALLRTLPNFYEPGILIALPASIAAVVLFSDRRVALLSTVSAPLYCVVCVFLEEYYLFHTLSLDFAAAEVLDAQTVGCVFLFLLWRLPRVFPKRLASRKMASAE